MSTPIRAIQTSYKGYRFRSRLESRWVVFFDTLGIPWEYEREGYNLGEIGWYLPDFWLPDQKIWIEIKHGEGKNFDPRYLAFSDSVGPLVLLQGVPSDQSDKFGYRSYGYHGYEITLTADIGVWHECAVCGAIGFGYVCNGEAVGYGMCEHATVDRDVTPHLRTSWDCETERISRAQLAARSARFEHGESGSGSA